MPLSKVLLKTGIKNAFIKQANKQSVNDDPMQSIEELSEDLTNVIYNFIKTGTVNTTVTGSSVTGGPVTAKGIGNIV